MLFGMRNKFIQVLRDNPEGGGGGPAPKETFTREYVHELREENKATRVRAQEAERKAQEAEEKAKAADAAIAKAKEEAEAAAKSKAEEAEKKANSRIIRAELKALAVKEGIVDLDGLKLVDLDGVTISEDGEIKGAEELIKKLKEGKPYLFGAPHTSNPNPKPKPDDQKPKKATEMTAEEYRAARAELLKKKR